MQTESNNTNIIQEIDQINEKIWNIRGNPAVDNYDPLGLANSVYAQAVAVNYTFGKAKALLNLGMGSFIILHQHQLAEKQINESISIFTEINDKKWVANGMLTLAIIQNTLVKPEQALYNSLKGIDFYKDAPLEDADRGMAYYVIGTVYKDLKKYEESKVYYEEGLRTLGIEENSWGGRILAGLSNVYTELGKYEQAIEVSLKSLRILGSQGNVIGESRALNDIGTIYKKQKNYEMALDYFSKALALREKSNLKQFAFGSLVDMSAVYTEIGEYAKAIPHLERAAVLAEETNQPARLAKAYRDIANNYRLLNDFKQALEFNEKFLEVTLNIHKTEREAKLDSLQNALLQEKEQEIERLKNVELKNAYHLISEKNKEITDSIQYAKRIQKALLASDDLLNANLPEHFVLFKPKDIVSGDFYWGTKVVQSSKFKVQDDDLKLQTSNSELFFLAVCDSTGHGVPGAFMSLLNITFLTEAISEKNIFEPHLILGHVRERLISAISQEGGKDGMDGILACIEVPTDKKNKDGIKITYAAANNSPVLKTGTELKILPCDKMPVGKGEKTDPFTLHTINLKKDETLYLYTDGYADQFGGQKGKKFKYKPLNELILQNSKLPMKDQSNILLEKFENWKGELEQVDDVCIIGIRF